MDAHQPFEGITNTLNSRKRQSHDHPDNQAVENGNFVRDLVITVSF